MCQQDGCSHHNSGPCACQTAADAPPAETFDARRLFLQRATTVTLGALSLTVLPLVLAEETEQADAPGEPASDSPDAPAPAAAPAAATRESGRTALYGFLVDTERCIGSGKCLTACRVENNVPEGNARTWVERYIHFKDGTVRVDRLPETGFSESGVPPVDPETVARAYFVPKLCNHCAESPCNQVCPVHAAFTSPDGFVLVDPKRCIGCAYCVQACAYGSRFINHETGTADKCTWCYHRVKRGEQPACVEACPVDARVFGRVDDPNSEISKRLAQIPTHVLKEYLGTHPKTRYAGLSQEVI